MHIESKIKRDGGTHIDMGTAKYHFTPQADGAHVAEVSNEVHQDRFLSISEGFRLYRPGQPAAPVEVLLGSDVHPASFTIGAQVYALGDIVAKAHKNSGQSVADWNELDPDTRAALIDDELDALEAAALPAPEPTGVIVPITPEENQVVTQAADALQPPQEPQPPVDMDAVRAELAAQYKAKTGNAPHYSWDADKIRAKMAE